MRLDRKRLPSTLRPWLLNRTATMAISSGSDIIIISDDASLDPTPGSASKFQHFNSDYPTLVRILEACKLRPNVRTAFQAHARMIQIGYARDMSLLSLLISIYVAGRALNLARQLLEEIHHWDFELYAANLMISDFMKVGEIDTAKRVFHKMPIRDVVSWNSVIGGYVNNGRFEGALSIFREMLNSKVEPDAITFASVISGCARLGALGRAKWVHGLMVEKKIELNHILCAALIDMYAKCGKIETAGAIFRSVPHNDTSVWNALINGFAVHGLALEAFTLFSEMVKENASPDSVTFVGILAACSHCGMVEQGQKYFNMMRRHYLIQPQIEHYGAMVDLLGRGGLLEEAYTMIMDMPMKPDIVIWRAFLSACRTHKNSRLGEVAIAEISHRDSGDYVLLSNMYCSTMKWDSAERVRNVMKKNGIKKNSGWSWIELNGCIHKFKAGDRSHPETDGIYKLLQGLIHRTRMEGYVPFVELVLMDVSEEEKEENLNYHSEKLALAYAILKTSPGTDVQVSKNLRTCSDCHHWMKIASKVLHRVIIMRDRIRFHRFENGLCTCNDYW